MAGTQPTESGTRSRYASVKGTTRKTKSQTPPLESLMDGVDAAAYQAMISHGHQIACLLTADKGCHYITSNWGRLTGYPTAASMGRQFFDKVHAQHRTRLIKALTQCAEGKSASVACQVRHAEGHWLWIEFTPIDCTEGQQVLCILRDVTKEIGNERTLHKASLDTELAQRARSEFLAHMSHELRTPLNAILGFTQMIENQVYGAMGNDRYEGYISNIRQSGSALLSKLNDLFEIAHIDGGDADLKEEAVDMADLIHQAIEIHSHKAFSHQVKIRTELPHGRIIAHIDRVRMLKVLVNLLSNAIKFNKKGGKVVITTSVGRRGELILMLSDTGQGMRVSQLKRIINAAKHVEGFLSRDRDHVGVGLALAVELIRFHQGTIDIESEVGRGSHISIVLPPSRVLEVERAPRLLAREVELA